MTWQTSGERGNKKQNDELQERQNEHPSNPVAEGNQTIAGFKTIATPWRASSDRTPIMQSVILAPTRGCGWGGLQDRESDLRTEHWMWLSQPWAEILNACSPSPLAPLPR